jgi:hypothetical protein
MMFQAPLRPRIIFVNGPPRSGKDEIGRIMSTSCPHVQTMKFAQPLIDAMQSAFGVSCVDGYDKMARVSELFGRNRREVAIAMSEDFYKPMFGDDVFGKICLQKSLKIDPNKTIVFTDSGFRAEAEPIIAHYLSSSIEMVTVSRPGTNFDGDSRSYWRHNKIKSNRVVNNGTYEDLEQQVYSLMDSWRL